MSITILSEVSIKSMHETAPVTSIQCCRKIIDDQFNPCNFIQEFGEMLILIPYYYYRIEKHLFSLEKESQL